MWYLEIIMRQNDAEDGVLKQGAAGAVLSRGLDVSFFGYSLCHSHTKSPTLKTLKSYVQYNGLEAFRKSTLNPITFAQSLH